MPLLQGVKVLELGAVAMAPYAGQWLADLGADVIKIEPPEGDTTRRIGPTTESNMSPVFLGLNRNKRSVVLDLTTEAGQQAFLTLVDSADIVFHNTRQQKLAKLGANAEALMKRNPRIVYAHLQGYGAGGPYAGRPAYDDIIQGESGLAHLMGAQLGEPRYVPAIVADKTTGLFAVISMLAALNKRQRTGEGVALEIPMFESMVAFNAVEHLYGASFEPSLTNATYPRIMSAYRRPFATADGYICMLPYTDMHWRSFFAAAGTEAVAADPRFIGIEARTTNIAELYRIAADAAKTKTTDEWMAICLQHDIPCGPVRSIDDLLADEHLAATGFFTELEDAGMGRVRMPGVPVLVDGERPAITFPPRLGEHTRDVLEQHGVPQRAIAAIEAHNRSRNPGPPEQSLAGAGEGPSIATVLRRPV